MTTIEIKTKTFQVPTTWNELSTRQLLNVMGILYQNPPADLGRLLLLKELAQVPTRMWNHLAAGDVSDFLYIPDFLLKDSRLTKMMVPTQWHRLQRYVGPADNFDNLLMAEFVFTENYFLQYKEDETQGALLDNLCAVLFRPRRLFYNGRLNAKGDARQAFNLNKCLHRAATVVKDWPRPIKLAILTWYEACRLQTIEDFPAVFQGGGDGDPAKYGLVSMMRNVAEKGVHGNFEKVENMFVKMVMIELDEMLNEAEQIKKLQKTNP